MENAIAYKHEQNFETFKQFVLEIHKIFNEHQQYIEFGTFKKNTWPIEKFNYEFNGWSEATRMLIDKNSATSANSFGMLRIKDAEIDSLKKELAEANDTIQQLKSEAGYFGPGTINFDKDVLSEYQSFND